MGQPVIQVENISKSYILKHRRAENYTALRDVISDGVKNVFRKNKNIGSSDEIREEFWALNNVSFEVQKGDRVGIIGRNGAGKSTLLKILSRIVSPTKGKITIEGRVASLLEVGTGFHPELTGRENIFLNGSILGMSKSEIKSKFDEIVDFSGVEKFLDTPVKRYSSGMYVRLAFSVAAHLEPEILIVDEVLAVGDAEFQKKCLGKMNEVSKSEGRTILFVSHNMAAIQNLCKYCVLLSNGQLEMSGETGAVINHYMADKKNSHVTLSQIKDRKGNGKLRFISGRIKTSNALVENTSESFSNTQFEIEYKLNGLQKINNSRIDIGINNFMGDRIAWLSSDTVGQQLDLSSGKICFNINKLPLAPGDYNCNLYCEINNEVADWITNVLGFSVVEKDYYGTGKTIPANQGNILLDYSIEK